MEISEFFQRRQKERWDPLTETVYLQKIIDKLDEGGYPTGKEAAAESHPTQGTRAVRKWVRNRLNVLQGRLSDQDPRYSITKGKSGGLTTEKRIQLEEKRILHAVRAEIEEMACTVDRGVDTLKDTEDAVNRLPPFEVPINRSQLARRVGVTVGYISRILSGQRQPSLHVLGLIAGVWGVGLEDTLDRIRVEIARGNQGGPDVPRRSSRGVHDPSHRRARTQ
jgi:transcriptional regulator with XRE-family HTH domain